MYGAGNNHWHLPGYRMCDYSSSIVGGVNSAPYGTQVLGMIPNKGSL